MTAERLESIELIGRIWRACKFFGAQGAGMVGVMCDVLVSSRTRQAPSVARAIGGHRMKIEETIYKDFLAELNKNIASLIPRSTLASPMPSLMQCITP